jgi:uncharacterized protein DUF6174
MDRLETKERIMNKAPVSITLLAVLVAACSPLANSELARNRETWQVANVRDYRFELSVVCFCGFTQKMPLAIEVRGGQVVSMTYNDGTPVEEQERALFQRYETIDALFDYTAGAMSDADEIHVGYDPTYGYPASLQIDFIKNAADDELSLLVQGFEPLN